MGLRNGVWVWIVAFAAAQGLSGGMVFAPAHAAQEGKASARDKPLNPLDRINTLGSELSRLERFEAEAEIDGFIARRLEFARGLIVEARASGDRGKRAALFETAQGAMREAIDWSRESVAIRRLTADLVRADLALQEIADESRLARAEPVLAGLAALRESIMAEALRARREVERANDRAASMFESMFFKGQPFPAGNDAPPRDRLDEDLPF